MKHSQAGYQSAKTAHGFVAVLHGTTVLEKIETPQGPVLIISSGGWHTRATTKAINGALQDFNLSHRFHVRLQNDETILEHDGGAPIRVGSSLKVQI